MCSERGVFFTYVDLRWGISTEQSSDGQTIAICLQEVCIEYGRTFYTYVDLRWGISTEQSSDGQTIAVCLQEVGKARYYETFLTGKDLECGDINIRVKANQHNLC